MAKTIATVLGAAFILVGLTGFVAPALLGFHLSTAHNLVHLISGAAALYFGLAGTLAAARLFDLVFGAVYGLLGIAGFVRHMQRATFIGEESGGTYEGNTSGLSAPLTLPHSKLRLNIHMYGYWNAVSPRKGGRGTLPDHVVERRASDLLLGVDAALERAVTLAMRKGLSKS